MKFDNHDMRSHKVAQGAISMEQKLRFGLDLGQLAMLKKKLGQL